MKRVVIESPYAGDVELNLRYLRACMRDCLLRGESPFASHGLYTQPGVLDDGDPDERAIGIRAGFAWRLFSTKTVVYTDLGITDGMRKGIDGSVDVVRDRDVVRMADEEAIERTIALLGEAGVSEMTDRLLGMLAVLARKRSA